MRAGFTEDPSTHLLNPDMTNDGLTPATFAGGGLDLTIVIPARNEGANLRLLLPRIRELLDATGIRYELLVVTDGADADTREAATGLGARALTQVERGYGGALIEGFAQARGAFILTMDANLSHDPTVISTLWQHRMDADVVIASRYVADGNAEMPLARRVLSRILNPVFARGLSLPFRDLSSGFRLYRAPALRGQALSGRDFDVLLEILVNAFAEGWRVREVPFHYARRNGRSKVNALLGIAYLRQFWKLWKLRNSILAADYDDRAYDSSIPLQRYWQRRRFRHVIGLVAGEGPVLDVGCGSSRIISALPPGSVALDLLMRKLRYARRFSVPLVQGSGFHLPFKDHAFTCVLCSQVIEHVPKESPILEELCRVLAPGGRLVLGTPDYARIEWVVTEKLYGFFAPGAYADEHIAHYTRAELIAWFEARGFKHEATRYILRGELILAFRKHD